MKRFTWTLCASAILLSAGWGLGALENPAKDSLDDSAAPPSTPQLGISVGPDVTIKDLSGISNHTFGGGSPCPPGYGSGAENCRGYSVGTNSCNVGSIPLDWCDQIGGCRTTTDAFHPLAPATVSDHSVISQNMYRLKDGRFEQIGASFLKHGFFSLNTPSSDCAWNDGGVPNTSCVQPPAGGDQLGVGCTDFYNSGLNGNRPMGRRSDVQVAGADHPPSAAGGETDDAYDQRIVVAESHLDPAQNAGALYWMEGQYVVRDDARAGNGLNNASHRQATVGALPSLNVSMTGPTIRELPAIFAWQSIDPEVDIVAVDKRTFFLGEEADAPIDPGTFYPNYTVTERFWAARKVTLTGGPTPYHYEYAIYNLNSDTSADSFTIDFGQSATFSGAGFRDLPHHSGEPYDTSDWTIDVDGPNGTVTWTAVDMGTDTNALRWGFTFNFWFDADIGPNHSSHTLGTFKDSGSLDVPFDDIVLAAIFADGFESGDTSAW
ncbi:MAG: hypothetical protein V3T72_18585 [Thermoanaerobaculia bacterium]